MKHLDLRSRLFIAFGLVAALQVLVAFALISMTRNHLVGQIDDRLTVVMPLDRGPRLNPPPERPGEGDRPPTERLGDTYEGRLLPDGSLTTFFAPNSTGVELAPPAVTLTQAESSGGTPITVDAQDNAFRYRLTVTSDRIAPDTFFITAIPLDGVDNTMSRLTAVVIATVAITTLALAVITLWMLRLGIDPIKRMTRSAEAIADGDLSERLSDVDQRTEAGQLGLALNTMLGHIETSFAERARAEDKLRQFIADASHELRTPATTIRGYAELYQAGGLRDQADLDDAMRRTEQESQRMSRLISDMLNLAKLDRQPTPTTEPVDLASIARDAAADAQVTHPDRTIVASIPDDIAMVTGDEDLLRQAMANIVGNAIVHTNTDAHVTVDLVHNETDIVVSISDAGEGMPPEVVSRVTERFYRADGSRSRHQGGSGLGLAIADSIIASHHGTLRIDSTVGTGTVVTVSLPAHILS